MATGVTAPNTGDQVAERLRAVYDLCDQGAPFDQIVAAAQAGSLTRAERRRLDTELLAGPLGLRLDVAAKRGKQRRREAIDALRPYLARVEPRVKRELPVVRRVAYHLIESRDPEELAESDALAKLAAAGTEPSRRVRKGLRWYADLPVEVEPGLLRLRKADLVPVTQIDDISWVGGRLRVTGHAYLAGLSVRSRRFNRATVVLRGPRWLPPIAMRTSRIHRPEATHSARETGCNYDWAGFTAELRPWSLRWRAAIRSVVRGTKRVLRRRPIVKDTTTWRAEIVIWSRGARATGLLRGPAIGRTERPDGLEITSGRWIRPVWTSDRALQIVLQPTRAELTGATLVGDAIELSGFLPGRPVTKGRARLGGHRVNADFHPVEGGTRFSVWLATSALLKEKEVRRLWVEPRGMPAASLLMKGEAEARLLVGDREIAVLRDRRDRATIAAHRIRPVITEVGWDAGTLTLSGDYPDPTPGARELTLRHKSGLTFRVPVERDGDRFTVRFAPGRMPRLGATMPLGEGVWTMQLAGGAAAVPLRFDHALLDGLDESPVTVDGRLYRMVATRFDVPVLVAAEDKRDEEKGAAGQAALRRTAYQASRSAGLTDATVYLSYEGRCYSDNPRAIYEERVRRGDDREHIWVVADGAFTPPDSRALGCGPGIEPRVVRVGSREYYEALARSRYVVTNGFLPSWFRARDEQVVVQTWHGTPAKRIGGDQPHMAREPRPPAWHRQAAEVANWDLLVSQSPWASAVLRQAFEYEGEIVEYGYPRNDILLAGDRAERAAEIRRALGIPEGRRVVLYAPTYRDYDRKSSSVRLDLNEAAKVLGGDHVLLVRSHMLQAFPSAPGLAQPGSLAAARLASAPPVRRPSSAALAGRPSPALLAARVAAKAAGGAARPAAKPRPFALDVTTYPDMAELLLVADVLITDYSAAMFDFAVTGRPMIFFTPDLPKYSARRGLYLDLPAQAPGPVVTTPAEVVEAIRNIDALAADYADRYAAFTRTYAPRDDGKATLRLVDHVFPSA